MPWSWTGVSGVLRVPHRIRWRISVRSVVENLHVSTDGSIDEHLLVERGVLMTAGIGWWCSTVHDRRWPEVRGIVGRWWIVGRWRCCWWDGGRMLEYRRRLYLVSISVLLGTYYEFLRCTGRDHRSWWRRRRFGFLLSLETWAPVLKPNLHQENIWSNDHTLVMND